MCGIAGIFSYHARALPVDADELLDIRDAMSARGPDGAGIWMHAGRRIGLAHRRLAIVDLSDAASQPMSAHDGTSVVTFNGEIYNYRELRSELARKGYPFRSNSDTEVLLALYREHGEGMVHRLRGMYAFAIWDEARQRLFLARDPFGIKPLYYCDDGSTLRFASQVRALVKGGGVKLTPDPAGHTGFFIFGYVPEPYTLYRQIRSLPAGCALSLFRGSTAIVTPFFEVAERVASAEEAAVVMNDQEQAGLISAALADSVAHHLIADVPVGVFLSAGIDSNVIASQVASSARLRTVTLGFEEFQGTTSDEVPLAEAQALRFGAQQSTRKINREEFFACLSSILAAMDQPSSDGVNSWLVSKAAAEQGLKVWLSGLGGDELFGGYPGFRQLPRIVRTLSSLRLPKEARAVWRSVVGMLPERLVSRKYAALLDSAVTLSGAYLLRRCLFTESELVAFLDPELLVEGLQLLDLENRIARSGGHIKSEHARISAMELYWYTRGQLLRDVDWASMAHGIEVRVPYIDVHFFDALLPLLVSGRPPSKRVLAMCASGGLPQELTGRRKTGFTTPVRGWLESRYPSSGKSRGLRNWARAVYGEFMPELSLEPSDPIPPKLVDRNPIVLYRIGQLGDTLVSLPAIEALRRQYPKQRIVLLTDRHPERHGRLVSAWDVIGPTGLVDGVIYYPVVLGAIRNLPTYFRLAKRIRALTPTEVVNLAPRLHAQEAWRDRFFFETLCGVRRYRAVEPSAHSPEPRGWRLTRVEPEWWRLLRAVEGNVPQLGHRLHLPRWAISEGRIALSGFGKEGQRLIGLGPGSKMPAKRWPLERFLAVGHRILEENQHNALAVLGDEEDRKLGAELCGKWGARSLNLAGSVSVFGTAAVLSQCVAYLGNDTGTMHIAAAMGIPCVAVFSARDNPGRWEPYGTIHAVLRKSVECAGCMLEVCPKNNQCLNAISIDEVVAGFQRTKTPDAVPRTASWQVS